MKTDKKITGIEIPISAVMGDQQAAAVGQTCFEKGTVKTTYGTGAFVILNTGSKKINSKNKLLTTICYRLKNKNTRKHVVIRFRGIPIFSAFDQGAFFDSP